jgi:hypothetical protein
LPVAVRASLKPTYATAANITATTTTVSHTTRRPF